MCFHTRFPAVNGTHAHAQVWTLDFQNNSAIIYSFMHILHIYLHTHTHTHTHRFVNSKLQCNFCIQKLIGVQPKMRLSGVPQRTQALYVHTPTYLSNSVRTNGSSQPHWLTAAEFAQRSRYIARLHCVDTVALPLSSEQL